MTQECRDICSNCANAASCVNRSSSDRPVWQCEQFDLPPVLASQASVVVQPKAASAPAAAQRAKGLCINCERRDSCAFPMQEGGVWHCAEYQ